MSGPSDSTLTRSRLVALGAVIAVCVAFAAGYLLLARAQVAPSSVVMSAAKPDAMQSILGGPHLVYLIPSGGDPRYNYLAVAPLDGSQPPATVGLTCARAYYAAGRGLCMGEQAVGGAATATLFDSNFHAQTAVPIAGLANQAARVRVSSDGRYVATTTFVTGDGYTSAGFSTRTSITDTKTGVQLALEDLKVTLDGKVIQAPNFNFWGVTFERNSDGFFATLGSGAHRYLIHASFSSRQAKVIRDGVECPSLSADGTRIVFKSPITLSNGQRTWRLHVLDLGTMTDSALSETRSVDDQAEWLDNRHVLYALNERAGNYSTLDLDLWSVDVNSPSAPTLFRAHAVSPAVVR